LKSNAASFGATELGDLAGAGAAVSHIAEEFGGARAALATRG
jgi:hypothetical protein